MSAKPPAAKKVKLTIDQSTEIIKNYTETMTRPYSLTDILTNTKGLVSKTVGQRIIDQLVADGKLLSKTFGKQVVYYPLESENLPSTTDLKSQLELAKTKVSDLKSKLKDLKLPVKMSKQDAEIKLAKVKESIQDLTQKLDQTEQVVDESTKIELETRHAKALKSFKSRRRMFYEAFKTITENMPNEKQVLEDIGIETDEMVG